MKQIILIDDDADLRRSLKQTLELANYRVADFADAASALKVVSEDYPGVVVSDIKMPEMDGLQLHQVVKSIDQDIPVMLITGHADVSTAVKAIREGVYDFMEKPFRNSRLLETLDRAVEKRRLVLENRTLRSALSAQNNQLIIGRSAPVRNLKLAIQNIADADVDVLVRGETGVGKELVARSLHQQSARRDAPFVAVNCAAIPESMVESELFGFEEGSFTGAIKQRIGRFEAADGGTVFLDEIESIPMQLAVKILRVLQERCVERLGSNEAIPLDIRVVAATKVDLYELSQRGEFREDLYYRLNVMELLVPPLRERQDDIAILFEFFVDQAAQQFKRPIPILGSGMLAKLIAHSWPGNVRELKNMAKRYVLEQAIPADLQGAGCTEGGLSTNLPAHMDQLEKLLIEQSLQCHQGNIKATYEALGIPRKTLYIRQAETVWD